MRPNTTAQRARAGQWEEAYLDALSRGHIKATAAALAGCSKRTPYACAERDPGFREREQIAFNLGTAVLESIAFDRITDPVNPADGVLRHLLACRAGLNPKQQIEMSGLNGGPTQEDKKSIPLDMLSIETKRRIIQELEAAGGGVDS